MVVTGYFFLLNIRLSRELFGHQWRTPTEIYSGSKAGPPRLIAKVYGSDWRVTYPLRLEQIPQEISNAFIAAEDIRFRKHFGVDPIGIARALFTNLKAGGTVQGGSTINQQLVKAKVLSQDRTYRRKLLEGPLAILLDLRMSKDEILEAYLNDVYLGHVNGRPVLGLDEGARLFYDKAPAELRVDEAALIAGIIRAPNRDTPDKRPELARARRNIILKRMLDEKWIEEAAYQRAIARPVNFRWGRLPVQPYPFYFAALRNEVINEVGRSHVLSGGLMIVCELDQTMQQNAENAARRGVRALQSRYSWIRKQSSSDPLQAAILSVDPRTGGIRALVGGSDFKVTRFDRTSQMRRQPGSAFKPFAFLAAIASREATNASLLLDSPIKIQLSKNETWEPHNYDERFRGQVTVREALEKSLNIPTIRLTERIGTDKVVTTAQKFGFTEEFKAVPALPLGVTEVTMDELTGAYTAFPNLGERVTPFLLTSVKGRNGKALFAQTPERIRVADPGPTYIVHSLLRGVVQRGTATRLKKYGLGHVAGKTGTTSDYRDAWFVGYTPDLVTTVWVGFDRGAPLRLSSAEAALPIWGSYMREIKTDRTPIEAPSGVVSRDIDPESGYLWAEGCPGPVREVFLSGTAPSRGCPRGVMGRIVRKVLFDDETFDEPTAITFDKFRRWTTEIDRNRQEVESGIDRLRKIFGDNEEPSRGEKKKKAKKRKKDE